MLDRTLTASVVPRGGRLRAALPSPGQLRRWLSISRQRSLRMQDRVERARARCNERYSYGRRS